MDQPRWIDELERDLGLAARLRLVANVGGQTRHIPVLTFAGNSKLASEIGSDAARWLAYRFGGGKISFPSITGADRANNKTKLEADILEAGLYSPTRTANEIAQAHGVSSRWVEKLRSELRADADSDQLSLFPVSEPVRKTNS